MRRPTTKFRRCQECDEIATHEEVHVERRLVRRFSGPRYALKVRTEEADEMVTTYWCDIHHG